MYDNEKGAREAISITLFCQADGPGKSLSVKIVKKIRTFVYKMCLIMENLILFCAHIVLCCFLTTSELALELSD